MASSFKHFLFLFLLILFSDSLQIHARESQFFSKVTASNNNVKEMSQLPNKEEPQSKQLQEQEPNFIPDTEQGYGLYGHGSGQLPPSTPTNSVPYTSGNNIPYTEYSSSPNNNNNYYYNKNSYNSRQQGMKDTSLFDRGYTTMTNPDTTYYGDNKYNYNYNNNNNNYNNNNNNNNGYNTVQQGMSDTRFLENGKYFYNVDSENNYRNEYDNSRVYSRRGYNNRGYYGNGNENSSEFNSMEGYQNEEFQESPEEYVP